MDFKQDIRNQIISELPDKRNNLSDLQDMKLADLLIDYLNWRARFIPVASYNIYISSVLKEKLPLSDTSQNEAINAIKKALSNGADLTPHLSRGVGNAEFDLLLNDWGVHHLHLSTDVENDGFVKRTGPLLFIAIRGHNAYFLDIVEHGRGHPDAWVQQHILELMARELPDDDLVLRSGLHGPNLASSGWTADDRMRLRKNGFSAGFYCDGEYCMPHGITNNGASMISQHKCRNLLRKMQNAETQIKDQSGPIWETILKRKSDLPSNPEFHFKILDTGCGVFEVESNTFFKIEMS